MRIGYRTISDRNNAGPISVVKSDSKTKVEYLNIVGGTDRTVINDKMKRPRRVNLSAEEQLVKRRFSKLMFN